MNLTKRFPIYIELVSYSSINNNSQSLFGWSKSLPLNNFTMYVIWKRIYICLAQWEVPCMTIYKSIIARSCIISTLAMPCTALAMINYRKLTEVLYTSTPQWSWNDFQNCEHKIINAICITVLYPATETYATNDHKHACMPVYIMSMHNWFGYSLNVWLTIRCDTKNHRNSKAN